jgi:hypothetical protein
MRWLGCIVTVILLASAACDNKQEGGGGAGAAASASAAAAVKSAAPEAGAASTAPATPDEAGAKPAAIPMPERPIPRPQTMVGSGMSIEVQQKAIAYMVAMRAPHPDDVGADPAYANDLVTKLKPIVLSMDSGADKRLNRVEVVANGRQIDLLMAGGCDEKTPQRAVTSRAGVSVPTLVSHGVLVIRCNDARVQCLQSTRDPEDVLCTTAPRHK